MSSAWYTAFIPAIVAILFAVAALIRSYAAHLSIARLSGRTDVQHDVTTGLQQQITDLRAHVDRLNGHES